jgi:hypothetical protein
MPISVGKKEKFNFYMFDLSRGHRLISYMDFSSRIVIVAMIFAFTVLINLPFGYLRKKTKRYSLKWFLCIHIPIPFIFLARVLSQLDFRFIPLFIVAAIIGQVWGGKMDL